MEVTMQKFKPGDKVLVRSNENEPTLVGTFDHYEEKCHGIPVVIVDSEELYCMALVRSYSDELFQKLESMPGKEAWHWLVAQERNKE